MPSAKSDTDTFASSLHRGLLGALLAVLGIVGLSLARGLLSGEYVTGTLGVAVALGCGYWILSLFEEGLRET